MYCPTQTRAFFEATTERPLTPEQEREQARDLFMERLPGYAARFRGLRDTILKDLKAHGCDQVDIDEFAESAQAFLNDGLFADHLGVSVREGRDLCRLNIETQETLAALQERHRKAYAQQHEDLRARRSAEDDREILRCALGSIGWAQEQKSADEARRIARKAIEAIDPRFATEAA